MVNIYIASVICSFIFVVLFVPVSIRLANKFGVLDKPDPRKVHIKAVPRWGGIAIFLGIIVTLAFVYVFSPEFRGLLDYRHKILSKGVLVEYLSILKQLSGIIAGAVIVFVLGLIDDKRGVGSLPKLLVQVIAAYVALDCGVRISGINLPFTNSYTHIPVIIGQVITVFWIIGFINIVNLVDGLDGLAAGLVAIVAATFLINAVLQGDTRVLFFSKQLKLAAVISAGLAGACLGFLVYNFNPAKVFMGDSGSLTLGFLLGAITITGALKTSALISFAIPLVVVALPTFDVGFAILRRLKNKQPVMMPDRGHLHHRLLDRGWTQREIVLLMYVVTLLLSITSILLTVFRGKV